MLGALDDVLVVLLLVVLVVLLVVLLLVVVLLLDELVWDPVPPLLGPRLVSWMMPQITSASITAMSPNQAASTDRRRYHGVGTGAAKLALSACGGVSNALNGAYRVWSPAGW